MTETSPTSRGNDSFAMIDEMNEGVREQLPSNREQSARILDSLTSALDLDDPVVAKTTDTEPTMPTPIDYVQGRKASGVIRNIPYTSDTSNSKLMLDVYVPHVTKGAPIMIHIHGGGWSRGDRTRSFYGAPGLADAYAGMGFVAVAISYRLGAFPTFVEDAAAAISWVTKHIQNIDGLQLVDRSRIFLSGHSAGGHIASLLLTDPTFLSKEGVPFDIIRGLILLAGIYTLKNPFSSDFESWRNWAFQKVYIQPAFVSHKADLDRASPAWRLVQFLSDETSWTLDSETQPKPKKPCFLSKVIEKPKGTIRERAMDVARPPIKGIPTAIFSAESDLGLEFDAKRFYDFLLELGHTNVTYNTIPKTTHPSICYSELTYPILADAVAKML